MIVYACDILEKLKAKGYTTYTLRKDKLISQGAVQKLREGKLLSWHELDQVCTMLKCQPGDLVKYEESRPERSTKDMSIEEARKAEEEYNAVLNVFRTAAHEQTSSGTDTTSP